MGDDQGISVVALSLTPYLEPQHQLSGVRLRDQHAQIFEGAHGSAIRGMSVMADRVLSSGYDSRLRIWRLNFQPQAQGDEKIKLVLEESVVSELADISTLDAVFLSPQRTGCRVAVGGQGLALFDVSLE
eukprot:TRINITY_DN6952_c0_g1_i3.p1 TRINITY_DN6952_c0_g1~~TRINITY_DN6952_c0_g1_i3.p1  ORF type:complete len:137 (-),score=38.14 TRINITY_DN6952_c0_g1_i3:17-403(-)